jgi:hypothetical protein
MKEMELRRQQIAEKKAEGRESKESGGRAESQA